MGGGGVMRAAAKAAGGFGVFRGTTPAVTPAEHAVATAARKGTRAVSVASSTDEATWNPLITASENNPIDAGTQRPSWELDEWEFAGSEEEVIVKPPEPMPRLVFGCVPTLEEAKEATSELKDALDKIYLSSHVAAECGESHDCALSLLSKPEYSETKSCVISEVAAMPVPKNAIKAFKLLNESTMAQSVVASIASDPNVWNAVMANEVLMDFLQSQKSDIDLPLKESVHEGKVVEHQAPKSVDDSSDSMQSADSGNAFMNFLNGMKSTVVKMMSSLSDYFNNLFGGPLGEKGTTESDASARATFVDRALGASFMGLAVMVIMVVVLKRGI
ncbi:hypothetical protein NMG60_11037176 [Bertholletia excelsa]